MKIDRDTNLETELLLRHPTATDGAGIHALITSCPPLDTNSVYAYLLLTQYFSNTCVVAQKQGQIVGFISGFIVPQRTDTLFIWQVAVHPSHQGMGLATSMLNDLMQKQFAKGVRFVETTVSPSNQGSRALFNAWAQRWGTDLSESSLFDCSLFGGYAHEDEPLLKLGPFTPEGARFIS